MLLGVNVLVALSLVSAGAVYGYVHYRLNQIQTAVAPDESRETGHSSDGLKPENILFIGNETRCGLSQAQEQQDGSCANYSGSLSDVIMVAHLNPANNTASLLSIPRDLFAPMPGGSPVGPYQKIDAALNDGANGPDNLIKAIQNDLGIPINHYVELKFDGLQNVVNALGGVKLDFPEKLFDGTSLLFINQTGCQTINGTKALALVRSRELQYAPAGDTAPYADWQHDPESDLSRIVRDHVFLRVLFSTAIHNGLGDPLKLNNFLGAVINDMVMDPGLKNEILPLAAHYRHIDPNTIPELTLPITTVQNYYYGGYDIGDVDFPVQPADNKVIAQWDHTALPSPVKPSSVQVTNVAGISDLSHSTATSLTAVGLPAVDAGTGTVGGTPSVTFVQYNPSGGLPRALAVMRELGGAIMLDPDRAIPPGRVIVEAGSFLSVDHPAPAHPSAPSTTAPGGTAASTTTTTVPGPDAPSSSTDVLAPYDPRACPANPPAH